MVYVDYLRFMASVLAGDLKNKMSKKDDVGLGSLEIVVISAGLVAVAVILVTAVTNAVRTKSADLTKW